MQYSRHSDGETVFAFGDTHADSGNSYEPLSGPNNRTILSDVSTVPSVPNQPLFLKEREILIMLAARASKLAQFFGIDSLAEAADRRVNEKDLDEQVFALFDRMRIGMTCSRMVCHRYPDCFWKQALGRERRRAFSFLRRELPRRVE
jgi:hypothetical protein